VVNCFLQVSLTVAAADADAEDLLDLDEAFEDFPA
jgi:hypothetical protein